MPGSSMKCLSPRKIPARRVRAATPKGAFRKAAERQKGALFEVPCGECHPCRTNVRINHQTRVLMDFQGVRGMPVLLTLTYADPAPHTAPIPAGTMTPAQEKLYLKIEGRSRNFTELSKHDERKVRLLEGFNPAVPTVRSADVRAFNHVVRDRFGDSVLSLPNVEYGTAGGRPHGHALMVHRDRLFSQEEISWIQKRWRFGFVHALPAFTEKALRYIVKDTQKGSWAREYYTAEGREQPKVLWPRRPYIGAVQEAMIQSGLDRLASSLCPMALELRLQGTDKPLRYFKQGKYHRPFHSTAVDKVMNGAIESGVRDRNAVEQVRKIMEFVSWDALAETDPGDPRYRPDMAVKKAKRLEDARNASEQTKRRHEAIIRSKSRRGGGHPES